jgi:hypothetical protein
MFTEREKTLQLDGMLSFAVVAIMLVLVVEVICNIQLRKQQFTSSSIQPHRPFQHDSA